MELDSYMSKRNKLAVKRTNYGHHIHDIGHARNNMDLDYESFYGGAGKSTYLKHNDKERSFSFEPPQENFYLAPPR